MCINKYLEGGTDSALFDNQCKGRPVEITDDAVSWIIDIACQRPADLGYSQELWTLKNLHHYIQEHAVEVGYPRLCTITKPMVQKIIQAIATTGDDLRPTQENGYVKRDAEYKRMGTLSLLAGNYLATRPEGRFVFVFALKHGSWLNMIESFFSKMAKQMLRGIRVKSNVICVS